MEISILNYENIMTKHPYYVSEIGFEELI